MNKEILFFLEAVANEKGLAQDAVFEAVELALASAVKKSQKEEMSVKVEIDRVTGEYKAFRTWKIVDPDNMNLIEVDGELEKEVMNPNIMISITDLEKKYSDKEVGESIEEPLPFADFGRISAQTAKQVIFQKLRESSRKKIVEQFENRIGEIIHTTVKRTYRGNVFLDIGENIEGIMPLGQQIPGENYIPGRRLRAYLYEVGSGSKSPQIFFSRSMPAFLEELFKMEVPEINDKIIELKSIARDPGERAKIAVYTGDPHLDPIGTCVGVRGTRVHAVMNELSGEKIDVINWDNNPAEFVINALSPAEIVSISVDEDKRMMDISVEQSSLAQAIGKSGQNIRLASELTGWELNVMSVEEMKSKQNEESGDLIDLFVSSLNIDKTIAQKLVDKRINSIEEIAYMPDQELLSIEGFNEEFVSKVKESANDQVLMGLLDKE